jgi:solute carrier family 25 phosphate transporter 3
MVGEYNAYHYRSGVYLAASATAEAIADVFLSPFESVKVLKAEFY